MVTLQLPKLCLKLHMCIIMVHTSLSLWIEQVLAHSTCTCEVCKHVYIYSYAIDQISYDLNTLTFVVKNKSSISI